MPTYSVWLPHGPELTSTLTIPQGSMGFTCLSLGLRERQSQAAADLSGMSEVAGNISIMWERIRNTNPLVPL